MLTQHIRVHFCPLPELSDWLVENGQAERAQEASDIDLTQALEIAEKFQSSPKRKFHDLKSVGEETLYDCLQGKNFLKFCLFPFKHLCTRAVCSTMQSLDLNIYMTDIWNNLDRAFCVRRTFRKVARTIWVFFLGQKYKQYVFYFVNYVRSLESQEQKTRL